MYIQGMVEMEERKEMEDQRHSINISNCFDELDVMLNGPKEGRTNEMSIQVIREELLEEDSLEKQRVNTKLD